MAKDRLDLLDYYTLLGLDDGATADDVRNAFHDFAMKYHPDRFVGGSDKKVERATDIYRRGAEAYRVLTDPTRRQHYDEGLRRGRLRLSPEEETNAKKPKPKGVASVRSAKARPLAQKAERAIRAKDWNTARLNLSIALGHEPKNEWLLEMMKTVDEESKKK